MRIVQLTSDNRQLYQRFDSNLPEFGAAPEALLQGFASLPNVEIHVISCLREAVESPAKLADNIHYHSLLVPKMGWISTGYQGCIRAVRSLIRKISPDIVHGQGTEKECAMSAVYSCYPNVVTIHGNIEELNRMGETFHDAPLYGFLASRLETHSLRRTAGVFCNSVYTESLVSPRSKRTWRVPNAIRASFFQPANIGPKQQIPTLINVGSICPRKRQLELLRMIGEIVKSGRQIQVVFAGSLSEYSKYGAAFTEELHKAEAAGYASFVGFLDMPELILLMDSTHAFVHFPSEEAFGLVVAESMARGLKFFGANLGGIIDIATGIDGAELHDNFDSLKEGITRWLDAGAPSPANAAAEIAARYHPKGIAARHVEIYDELLGR